MERIPELYEVAKHLSHELGYDWTDPRTGVTHPAPDDKVKREFDADYYVRVMLPFHLGALLGLLDRGEYMDARKLVMDITNDLTPKIGGHPYLDKDQ